MQHKQQALDTMPPNSIHAVLGESLSGGHKSKEQRKQEAMERKRKYLDTPENNLRNAVSNAAGNGPFAASLPAAYQNKLVDDYIECGYSKIEAEGMARAVAKGKTRIQWST